jgi:predicted MFS family arabinose efflux permease
MTNETDTRSDEHTVAYENATWTGLPSKLSPARRWLTYALLVLLGFSLGCSEFVVIGIEPELASAFGCSISQVGDLISFFALSYAIATPLLAIFTSQFRRSHLFIVYLVIFVVCNLTSMTASAFWMLLASRIVMGAVAGALLAVATTYIPELLGPKHSSMGISVIYAAFSIALVLATSVGRFIVEYLTWQIAMEGAFFFALISAILLIITIPKSPRAKGARTSPKQQVKLLKEPALLFGVGIFMFGVGAVYTFYGYVAPYLEDVLGLTTVESGIVLLVFGCICFVSDLLSGLFDLRFGMRSLPPIFAGMAIALFGLWAAGPHVAIAIGATFLIALLMYSFSIQCISMFMDIARRKHPDALVLAASIEPTSFNIGIAFGTAIGGVVVSGIGLSMVGLVGATLALCALICSLAAIFFWKRSQRT